MTEKASKDKEVEISASKAAKELDSAMQIIVAVQKAFEVTQGLKIESRETTIRVPERTCEDDIAVKVRHPAIFSRKIAFNFPGLLNVSVHALGAGTPPSRLDSSLLPTTSGFEVKINSIPKGVEYLWFNVEYEFTESDIANALIRTDVQAESYKDSDEFWMHSCLKHPEVLSNMFNRLELKNIELNVDVSVGNIIKNLCPPYFTKQITVLREIASMNNRAETPKMMLKLIESRKRFDKDPYKILTQLDSLMTREKFREFVDLTGHYRFFDVQKGSDIEPSTPFPTAMTVISRTNLSRENPAVEGKLLFKKKDFQGEISKLF